MSSGAPSQQAGLDDGLGGEFERLEAAERFLERGAGGDHAVIFEDHAVIPLLEGIGHDVAQRLAAGQVVGGEPHLAADAPGLVEQAGVGHMVNQAEGHQRHRMGVHDASQLPAPPADLLMNRKFRRRMPRALDPPVRADADDVVARQRALVHARGRDPDVAVLFLIERLPPEVVVMR